MMDDRPFPNQPERLPKKKPSSLDDILKRVKDLNLDEGKIPSEMRIEELPPSKEIFEEVKSYVANELKLKTGGSPNGVISIAGEFVNRSLLGAGRVGISQNMPVFAFLYQHKNAVNVVAIYTRDGVDPRRVGQAIYWGIVSDIPTTIAQSKILPLSDFWAIKTLDPLQLCDAPVLEKFKLEVERDADRRVSKAEAEVSALKKQLIAKPAPSGSNASQHAHYEREAVACHNRAEMWKFIAISFATMAVVLGLIAMHLA